SGDATSATALVAPTGRWMKVISGVGAVALVSAALAFAWRERARPPSPSAEVRAETPRPDPAAAERAAKAETGELNLTCNVRCSVALDGRRVGQTPLHLAGIAAGEHRALLVADPGRSEKSIAVAVAPGAVAEARMIFGSGALLVRASPWAEVTIDGKPIGQTPLPAVTLLEGKHEVLLQHAKLRATR